jgi:surface protein
MADLNNISRSLIEYLNSAGITEERVRELINAELLAQVGDLADLDTNAKDLIVNAINELAASVSKINALDSRINEVFQLGNNVKQLLVDTLIANGLTEENISTSDTFTDLIDQINKFNNYRSYNVYKVKIPGDYTMWLANDLRGDSYNGTVYTDWGDGTIDTNTTHRYAAGEYTIITRYSICDTNGSGHSHAKMFLSDVININQNINNAAYMFYECVSLKNINANDWDMRNITNMDYMFAKCSNLVTLNNEEWNVSRVESAVNMCLDCKNLIE